VVPSSDAWQGPDHARFNGNRLPPRHWNRYLSVHVNLVEIRRTPHVRQPAYNETDHDRHVRRRISRRPYARA